MASFTITQTEEYRVEADTAEEALEKFVEAEDTNVYWRGCYERTIAETA